MVIAFVVGDLLVSSFSSVNPFLSLLSLPLSLFTTSLMRIDIKKGGAAFDSAVC